MYSYSFKKQPKNKKLNFKKIVLPFSAAALFVTTVSYWNNTDYGLALEYNGQQIATISDEKVYQEAEHLIRNQIPAEEKSAILKINPSIKITPVNQKECCEQPELIKEKIIEKSPEILSQGYAVYVDDELVTVGNSEEELKKILDEMIEVFRIPFGECKAEFEEKVEIKSGLFPPEKIQPNDKIKETLNFGNQKSTLYVVREEDSTESISESFGIEPSYLLAANGKKVDDPLCVGDKLILVFNDSFLHAKITRNETVENDINYTTLIEEDSNLEKGKRTVSQEGKNGKEKITYSVEYRKNKEVKRDEISREVTIEPIPEKIVVGTKVQEYIWPVPFTKNVTSPFGPRSGGYHYGIDIAWPGVNGTEIVASKSGKVEKVSLGNTGYGNHVIINHNDGTQTLYAHCKSVNVNINQDVTQGDVIAYVGTTGQSTGPHLHFEVRVNGIRKNPSNYIH